MCVLSVSMYGCMYVHVLDTITSVAILLCTYTQVFGCVCEWPSRDTADAGADMCCHGNTQVSEGGCGTQGTVSL